MVEELALVMFVENILGDFIFLDCTKRNVQLMTNLLTTVIITKSIEFQTKYSTSQYTIVIAICRYSDSYYLT